MNTFAQRYRNLNAAQKQAVDTIEGPVMVIAGPGTGKTELLSMRVANILTKTDSLPENILCLTFTESGASAMRERLVKLMGPAAYHVAIHTFHSFGSEIIHAHPQYFYHGAHFRPADELSSHEILRSIFEKLPHDDPLASQLNNDFTQLRDAQTAISELKRSGITPDELLKILDHNDQFIAYANPAISAAFATPLRSKKALPSLEPLREHLQKYQEQPLDIAGFTSLHNVCAHQFTTALDEALELGKTTPLTVWRSKWCEKNADDAVVLKDTARSKKLRNLSHVYYQYLITMQSRELYDFDDMILRVLHAIELFPELRYNLQERYQYILVDEFQDTNGAQLRILLNLTSNESQEGQPNILVVGDDDQAIYSFQGAELSNILSFRETFDQATVITLNDNYRSVAPVLNAARTVIVQGKERLENQLAYINKTLTPHKTDPASLVQLTALPTIEDEYQWLTSTIRQLLRDKHSAQEIVVLTRTHKEIGQLLPYLLTAGIAVNYERRDNVLDSPPIRAIEQVARILQAIAEQRLDEVQARLPELLAHPAWGIAPTTLWELSLESHKAQRYWLEIMLEEEGALQDIATWLITTAHAALNESLETIIDTILGTAEVQAPETEGEEGDSASSPQESFSSPLRTFFFPHDALEAQPEAYLSYLEALRTIRQKMRDYQPDVAPDLESFLRFIDLHRQTGSGITSLRPMAQNSQEAICLMTAHKSKGLEFETVFVVNAVDSIWGSKARSRSRTINFPANLPISPAGDSADERLRLFYVALTRAKRQLYVSFSHKDSVQKDTLQAYFLQSDDWPVTEPKLPESATEKISAAENRWHTTALQVPKESMQTILKPILENYKLSATHLNNFVDITNGGPQAVLLQNLLRFPQAMAPSAAFGSAIHQTLQRAHAHFSATGQRRPTEDILRDFEVALTEKRLSGTDHSLFLQKGSDALHAFLSARHDTFTEGDIVEKSFSNQGVVVGGATLTGAIDLLRVNPTEHTITITDYKTGKSALSWQGKTDIEKMKLHRYKQQLWFYKLLVEHSRDFKNYTATAGQLEFVEPNVRGDIVTLGIGYEPEDIARFKQLLAAVWRHIQALNFPDTSHYEQNYRGILAFEQDLIDGVI